jgi:2-polyprenyl-3-methyl-5-hydroxy-6-metoxy-1,4-benzoquinol methylase
LDVLEHLQDPWSLLSDLRGRLSAEGEVFVSIPNVRNFRVVIPLLLAGRWDYQKTGILDRTHLRFFTKASVKEMFRNAGYEILEWNHTGMQKGSITFWLNVLTLGTLRGFFELQYVVRAKPLGAG